MKSLTHLREKAIYLRTIQNCSLDDIADSLTVSRSTVYYWVKDIPIARTLKQTEAQKAGTAAMVAKCAARRQEAYEATYRVAATLLQDPDIRDFTVLYLAEGYRKDRNRVSFSNSNSQMIKFAHRCMKRLATNPHLYYSFQYHADQDPQELRAFWATLLDIAAERIHPIPKTNSGQLKGRRFACQHGIFMLQASDTIFRAQLQALMDTVQEQWVASQEV